MGVMERVFLIGVLVVCSVVEASVLPTATASRGAGLRAIANAVQSGAGRRRCGREVLLGLPAAEQRRAARPRHRRESVLAHIPRGGGSAPVPVLAPAPAANPPAAAGSGAVRGGATASPTPVEQTTSGSDASSSAGGEVSAATVPGAASALQVKALFMFFYAALGSLMPYLPVYYHSIGMSGKRIGVLGAITPALTFLAGPLWSALADQRGAHRQIMLFTFASSAAARCVIAVRDDFRWITGAVIVAAVLNAPVRPLVDSAVMGALSDKRQYGRQRLWGQVGFALGSSAIGPLLGATALGYKLAFLSHAVFSLPALLVMARFPQPPPPAPSGGGLLRRPSPPRFIEGLQLLRMNREARYFFFLVFAIGCSSGIIENFAYVRLREVGGDGRVMGASRLLSSIAGAPMFWYSGAISKLLGVYGVLMMALLAYVVRFVIYASIPSPWWALPAEALRGMTFGSFWATATYHAHRLAPPGLEATMLALLNAMYGGLGQSLGALVGGAGHTLFGTSLMFQMAAMGNCVLLVLLLLHAATSRKMLNMHAPSPILS